MARKKKEDELEKGQSAAVEETGEETAAEAAPTETAETAAPASGSEEQTASNDSVVDTVIDAAAAAIETVATTVSKGAAGLVSAFSGTPEVKPKQHKRAERIGIVSSDKMTKTVVVRVDRLVKHPVYRKYVKRRKKFMAHDELGSKIGDKVKIVETRPMSARKRWRVVEIIQRAEL